MKKILTTLCIACMASATLQAQFVIEKRNGETVKAQDRLTFAQDDEADEWSVGSTYDANLNLSLLQSIRRERKQETTTFEVKGLENQTVCLFLNNGEEVELTLDPEGKASYLLEPEAVIERLVTAEDQEIAIGRKSGGNICFRTENGQVVHRTTEAGKPIPVGIVGELAIVAGNPDLMTQSYRQENDLYFGGIAWEPIGADFSLRFTGELDGANHKIYGLTLNRPDNGMQYTALFGIVKDATFRNITIASGEICGFRYTAALAARADNTVFENCRNYANVTGTANATAGLVCNATANCTLENCHNFGHITGKNEAGGVTATLTGIMKNCTNYGNVEVETGGAAGVLYNLQGSSSRIEQCTNYGTIEATTNAAGVVANVTGKTFQCFNRGTVKGYAYIGGVAGSAGMGGNVDACENHGTVMAARTTAEEVTPNHAGGIIAQCGNGGITTNCLNGADAVIEGFVSAIGGICGTAAKGDVNNCRNLMEMHYPKATEVGSIAGKNMGTIAFCLNEVNVTGKDYVGGIAGYNHDGMKIRMCGNTAQVNGETFVGGICGVTWGTVAACINRGTVKGTQYVGGVTGATAGQYSYLLASYNTGLVDGTTEVGGVTGTARQNALVEASYSTGTVNGHEMTGGVCGSLQEGSAVTACYWSNFDGAACGEDDGTGAGNTVYYFTDGTQAPEGAETGWPDAETKNWGINPEGGQGTDSLWWKNLGVNGSQTYPQLWWEAE